MKRTRSKKSRDTVPLKGQCHEIATGINDAGGKFATGVNDTGGE
jgi:hypothetical protein